MVVSLYVCQIPENVTKEDLINAFREVSGYIDTRIKVISDKARIAFIDFEDEKNANFAKETLQGFKFTNEDKGIIIKFSENSRFSKLNKFDRKNNNKNNKEKNYRGRKRIRSLRKERTKNNNNINQNDKINNQNLNNNNNDINNQLESLVNNPLIKLIEQSNQNSNNQLYQNQTPQNQLLKNLTLLANVQNTNFNNNIQNNNLNINSDPLDNLISKYEKEFSNFEPLKNKATNIVYVEGIPIDAKEREVAHIFRPFPGYRSLRLIEKEKNGENTILCFADFENVIQSTICINTLQGYRFDKNDLVGLHCSYGVSKNKKH